MEELEACEDEPSSTHAQGSVLEQESENEDDSEKEEEVKVEIRRGPGRPRKNEPPRPRGRPKGSIGERHRKAMLESVRRMKQEVEEGEESEPHSPAPLAVMATELSEEQRMLLETWAGKAEAGEMSDEEGSVPLSVEGVAEVHQCHVCEKLFTSQRHVRRHLKKIHFPVGGVAADKPSGSLGVQCHVCQVSLTSKWHYLRHYKRIHTDENVTLRKRTITCPVCRVRVQNLAALSDHINKCHPEQGVAQHQILEFPSKEEFEQWKSAEERRSVSAFIQRRGMDKHCVIRYYCRRSGFYVTRGEGKRQTKSQGSCKVGSTCPAFIKAAFTPTGVTVTYSFTHVGHDADLKHIDLSSEERQLIADMIAQAIPFDDILAQVRENVTSGTLSRLHLVQRRDLNNIARDFRLTGVVRRGEGTTVAPRKPRGRPPSAATAAAATAAATAEKDLSEIDNMITFIRGSLETRDRSVIANAMEGLKSVTTQVQAALLTPKEGRGAVEQMIIGENGMYVEDASGAATNDAPEMYVNTAHRPGTMYINEMSAGLANPVMVNSVPGMISSMAGSVMANPAAMYANALSQSMYMGVNHSRGLYIASANHAPANLLM